MNDDDLYSPDEGTQEDAKPAAPDQEYWKAEAQKAFKARDTARQELRTHIQGGYDPEVVELVPASLDPKEWKEYADKLVAFRGQEPTVTPEPSSEEPAPEAGVPAETLAGIVNGPSHSARSGTDQVSVAEWNQLIASDSAEAERLFQAGKVNFSGLREGLGPDR